MSAPSVHSTMSWWLVFLGLVSTCFGACHLFPDSIPGLDIAIYLAGSPHSYVPGTAYPVWLRSSRKFDEFFITLDGENGGGSFQISTDSNVSFSEDCPNTLNQANPRQYLTVVKFLWNSPSYGCARISASIRIDGNWEETQLKICALEDNMIQKRPKEKTKCCACDHAKYKIIFEGLWSNITHPKDFPVTSQFTHFSDVIGATHSPNFTMWKEGGYSSYGFQQLAEYGVVRELDMELKNSSKHLRSIVRATGLWWPHVNSNTTAQFVVDPRHYLFSLASMFGPSPDWVVGLSSMNMCREDCSWLENQIIDLYPYDAGTDDGVSYQSPKVPTTPHERIRRITTMYPEDPRAPFYNPSATDFPPVARLYIYKEKVIPKKCTDLSEKEILEQVTVSENTEDEGRVGCEVGPYSEWSSCSVTCGKGIRMRQRHYLNINLAKQLKCDRQIISREMCVAGDKCPGDDDLDDTVKPMAPGECDVTAWSDWSECTVTCGIGMKLRQRTFVSSDERINKKCSLISMMEKEKCMMPICTGGRGIKLPASCATNEWSDWSTCSVTCGPGVITRVRTFKDPNPDKICSDLVTLEEKVKCSGNAKCTFSGTAAQKICLQPRVTGPCRADFPRFAFDQESKKCVQFSYGGCRGNKNNFETLENCQQTCEPPESQSKNALPNRWTTGKPQNCVVSKWSEWSECYPCTNGTRIRIRNVLVHPKNGGRKCPPQVKTVSCSMSEEFCRAMGLE